MTLSFVLATLICATVAMVIGGLWYSPILFGNTWKRLAKPPEQGPHPGLMYGGAFLLMLLGAGVFGAFIGAEPDLGFSVAAGASAGVAWAAGSLWISYLFEARPLRLGLINGSYHVVQYTAFGFIFGVV